MDMADAEKRIVHLKLSFSELVLALADTYGALVKARASTTRSKHDPMRQLLDSLGTKMDGLFARCGEMQKSING